MKTLRTVLTILLVFAAGLNLQAQTEKKESNFYIGLGTGLSSYIGGDFGKRYAIRFGYDDNADYYNRYNGSYYDNNSSSSPFLSPQHVELIFGVNLGNNASLELSGGYINHSSGDKIDENVYGSSNNLSYVDRDLNPSLVAIPFMASLKLYPFGKDGTPFYFNGGFGYQYTREKIERVREFYSSSYYYGNYYNEYYYTYPIESSVSSKWLPGIKVGAGYALSLGGGLDTEIELAYSNYFNKTDNTSSRLALDKSSNIGNIGLTAKLFFGL